MTAWSVSGVVYLAHLVSELVVTPHAIPTGPMHPYLGQLHAPTMAAHIVRAPGNIVLDTLAMGAKPFILSNVPWAIALVWSWMGPWRVPLLDIQWYGPTML